MVLRVLEQCRVLQNPKVLYYQSIPSKNYDLHHFPGQNSPSR